jgi:hypothetical protein
MNIAGRVLGPGDGEGSPQRGIWVFSQGFRWSNYDFPVGGAADGEEIQTETGDRRVIGNGTQTDCGWVQGEPLLKRIVTCVVIISVVFSIKKLVLWAYMHKYPEAVLTVFDKSKSINVHIRIIYVKIFTINASFNKLSDLTWVIIRKFLCGYHLFRVLRGPCS